MGQGRVLVIACSESHDTFFFIWIFYSVMTEVIRTVVTRSFAWGRMIASCFTALRLTLLRGAALAFEILKQETQEGYDFA